MARLKAPCPSCAAPVEFKSQSSLVAICPYCTSAVARGDKGLEDHGKVADLAETQSPLKVGARGRFRGSPFRLVGRVQYQHSAGGVWDEWYAQFANGKWGWLAEAQGRFYLTFEKTLKEGISLPSLDSMQPGSKIRLGDTEYTVAEVNQGTTAGAEGEMPWAFEPGQTHDFADLYAAEGQFATFDFSDTPRCSLGWQVTLEEIGMEDQAAVEREAKEITALKVNCPQCAGTLELRAPDETQRVSCPFCNSLLDCNHGNLEYLTTLKAKVAPLIELGSKGTLMGAEYMVIGFMQRSVKFDKRYYWTEYLLYSPKIGFRWLVNSDDHWSFVEPLSPADVHDHTKSATYNGKTFKLFQRAVARVEYVLGEFYWKVAVNEEVATRDLVAPPCMLSIERTMSIGGPNTTENRKKKGKGPNVQFGEVNISLGTWISHTDVEQAFGVKELPRSWAVAPNQPCPCDSQIFVYWLVFACAMFLIYLGASAMFAQADGTWFFLSLVALSVIPVIALFINHSFNMKRWSDSDYSPYSS